MTKKICYLTIDDAPSNNFKNKVNFLFQNEIPEINLTLTKYKKPLWVPSAHIPYKVVKY
jgi:hypothetical protein